MNKRKNKVILKGFEQHFILLSFLTVVTALILMIALIIGVIWLVDPLLMGSTGLQEVIYAGVIGFVLLAATYYYTLRVDHRVSGPVFVLMRNLDRVGEGDLTTEMRLRQQDHLQEISATFNRSVGGLRDQIKQIKMTAEAIRTTVENDEARALTEKLIADLDRIKTEME